MSNFVAHKKREHEAAAKQSYAAKDYRKAFFHTTKAAEFTLQLAEQCGGKIGMGYTDDAHALMDAAEELKELMAKEPPPKKTLQNRFQQEGKSRTAPVPKAVEMSGEADSWRLKTRPTQRLADVAGLEDVKQVLRDTVIRPFTNPEVYEQYKLNGGGGVLLYGPPGTGKTFIARSIAGELDAAFFNVSASELKNKYVGETEKHIVSLFKEARQHERSIIFIDECEDVLSPPPTEGKGVNTVNEFLKVLDGFEQNENSLLVIVATNKPAVLDQRVLRSKRIESWVYVGPPDAAARQAILERNMDGVPVTAALSFAKIAEMTEGYSGADIEKLCRTMKQLAVNRQLAKIDRGEVAGGDVERVTEGDSLEALDKVKSTIRQKDIDRCLEWRKGRDAGQG